ncbi:MAG: signal peptidase I [bacterium]
MKNDFVSSLLSIIKAFFVGIAYGFYDLIPIKKTPRNEPIDENAEIRVQQHHGTLAEQTSLRLSQQQSSWKKYYKVPEWRYFIVRELTAQIVIVLVLLIIVRTAIGEFRYIPSESMLPTLKIGDKLFVEKISRLFRKEYQRGDIVIFFPPASASEGRESILKDPISLLIRLTGLPFLPQPEAYIKRLIGLPGDKVEIIKGDGIYINDKKLLEPYHEGSPEFIAAYSYGAVTVPANSYLVFGDNRNFSYDSHYWGFLPKERVIGRAAFLIYRSLDQKPHFFDASML